MDKSVDKKTKKSKEDSEKDKTETIAKIVNIILDAFDTS